MASPDRERRSGLVATAGRFALFPARVAARASRDQLESAADDMLVPELARLIDHACAGPLPEEVVESLIRHRVLERVLSNLAASGALDRAVEEALESPRMREITDRVLRSDEMQQALRAVLTSPEVRAAMTQQTAGLAEELAAAVRVRAVRLDDRAERAVRRQPRAVQSAFGGIATRAVALAIDAAVIILIYVSLAALVALISSLVGTLRPVWLVGVLAGSAWALLAGGYLVLFWSGTGQTPGMRLLRLRVRGPRGDPPSLGRALLRAVGTVIAIVPLFAGYLPVLFDHRRRGLPDLLAGTVVTYDDPPDARPT